MVYPQWTDGTLLKNTEATSSPSVTECRFRVSNIVDDKHNLNLSYYGEKKLGGDDFNKCVNLKNDDDIEVIIVTHYEDGKFSYRNYKWRAGNTTGNLQ
jgi:hypothetical protein